MIHQSLRIPRLLSTAYYLLFLSLFTSASLSTGFLFTSPTLAQTCQPSLVDSYVTPSLALDVYVSGNIAYVADGSSGLQIIDVSNPAAPVHLGSYDTPGDAFGVYVSGNIAYVADGWSSGLQIIDVSDPENPEHLGSIATQDDVRNVYVSGSTAYVAAGSSGLLIIDVSNPAVPLLLGSLNSMTFYAEDVHVSDSTAYMADAFNGLQIINVSDPANPTLISSYDIPIILRSVYVLGNIAYVGAVGLSVIDVSSKVNPQWLDDYRLNTGRDVFVSGSTAYVADGSFGGFGGGLQIIDVSNPTATVHLGSYETPDGANGVYVSGSTAYVADGFSGLQIIDVSGCGPTTTTTTTTSTTTTTFCPSCETCDDGIDNDGDGLVDCDDPDCGSDPACTFQIHEICGDGIDNDGDGRTDRDDTDCYIKINADCPDDGDNCSPGSTSAHQWGHVMDLGKIVNDVDVKFEITLGAGGDGCSTAAYMYYSVDGSKWSSFWSRPNLRWVRGKCRYGNTVHISNSFRYIRANTDDCSLKRSRAAVAIFGEVCDDGVDNDSDGLIDCDDPDCFGPDCLEVEVCDDGVDNDSDGLIDCDDPDCFGPQDCLEVEVCNDGLDNDSDGLIDCDDPDCFGPQDCPEPEVCDGCPGDSSEGCISGRVTDRSGNPLSGKKVKLKRGKRTIDRARTNSDGCYNFTNVADGTYKVKVKCKGKRPRKQPVTITNGGNPNGVDFTCKK